jgi:protein-S-isoprenylcysteine O-methyltransferase Ste14
LPPLPPRWVPFALLLIGLLGEARTWRGYRDRAAPSAQDAGSFRLNNILGWVALLSGVGTGLALRGVPSFAVPEWLAWAGVPLALADTALRAWAVAKLGRWFSLTIQVRPGQPVVDTGPYRILRHPSYAGGDLALLGVGLSAGKWVSPLLFVAPWLVAHAYRIHVEERALLQTTGEPYRAYCKRTWRLDPFVW